MSTPQSDRRSPSFVNAALASAILASFFFVVGGGRDVSSMRSFKCSLGLAANVSIRRLLQSTGSVSKSRATLFFFFSFSQQYGQTTKITSSSVRL